MWKATKVGAIRGFRVPGFVPQVAEFRRAAVQIKGLENGALIAH
jgi:hypothetical protein